MYNANLIKITDFLSYYLRLKNHYSIINGDLLLEQIQIDKTLFSEVYNFFLSPSPEKPDNSNTWYLILAILSTSKSLPEIGVYRPLLSDLDMEIIEFMRDLSLFPPIPSWEVTLKELENPRYWFDCCPSIDNITQNSTDLVPYFPNFKAIGAPSFYIPISWLNYPHATLITLYIEHIFKNTSDSNVILDKPLIKTQYFFIPPNFKSLLKEKFNTVEHSKLLNRIFQFYPQIPS